MNPHYNQEYIVQEIDAILFKIKLCVQNNNYTISMNQNRLENTKFINEYNIRSDKQKTILLNLKSKDFCHSLQNIKRGFEDEVLL